VPTYGYACTACGHEFEIVQAMTDPSLTECPSCGGRLRKVFHPVGVTFKGSGFYRTDSRAGSSVAASGGSGSGTAATGSESSGSGSSGAGGAGGGASSGSSANSESGGNSSTPATPAPSKPSKPSPAPSAGS
jgi:putative FmdB family regulatory protein